MWLHSRSKAISGISEPGNGRVETSLNRLSAKIRKYNSFGGRLPRKLMPAQNRTSSARRPKHEMNLGWLRSRRRSRAEFTSSPLRNCAFDVRETFPGGSVPCHVHC